jgi:hypothetical protein
MWHQNGQRRAVGEVVEQLPQTPDVPLKFRKGFEIHARSVT